MSQYIKSTDFAIKDGLTTGDPNKIIKGTEINTELNDISTAIASKANTNSPVFTGNPTAPTQSVGNNSTRIATTAFVANAIANENLGTIATQDAVNVAITGGSITGITALEVPNLATAVTQSVGNSSTRVATTAFVNAEIPNGAATLFSGSNQSALTNGYQKLPGGIIFQWGSVNASSNSPATITFPIAFPNNVFQVIISNLFNGNNSTAQAHYVKSKSTTGAEVFNAQGDNVVVQYLAIGN
jgi:hypothetical protein